MKRIDVKAIFDITLSEASRCMFVPQQTLLLCLPRLPLRG